MLHGGHFEFTCGEKIKMTVSPIALNFVVLVGTLFETIYLTECLISPNLLLFLSYLMSSLLVLFSV